MISKVLHLCDGVGCGGQGVTGAMEVDMPPPTPARPANVPFCSKSLILWLFFFFWWMGTHVNFLKVLFNTGEGVPPPPGPLSPLPRLLRPLSRPLSLPEPSSAAAHPHTPLSACPSSSLLGFGAQISQSTKFSPWGGRNQETLYLFCMCIII